MNRYMTRERVIPALFFLALALDHFYPVTQPGSVAGAWIVPALMGLGALAGAIKGRRASKNANAVETYKAQRQNAIDQAEYDLAQAKRGERVRYANAIAKARGFVVPEFDTTASSGVKLNLPAVPKLSNGSWLDVVGDVAGGVGEGIMSEAKLNAYRDSLPGDSGATSSALGVTGFDPTTASNPTGITSIRSTPAGGLATPDYSAADPSQSGDPYAALLGRTDYFSNLIPRGR